MLDDAGRRQSQACGVSLKRDDGLAVHPVAEQVFRVGQIDFDAHQSLGVLGPGDSCQDSLERSAVKGVNGDHGRFALPCQDDVAIRNQHHQAHEVDPLHGQQRLRLAPIRGGTNQGPRVKRAMGHDPVEGGNDLRVLQVDPRLFQVRLGDSQIGSHLGSVSLGLLDGGPGGQFLRLGNIDLQVSGSLGGGRHLDFKLLFIGEQVSGRMFRNQAAHPLILLLRQFPAGHKPGEIALGRLDGYRSSVSLRLGHLDAGLGLGDLRPCLINQRRRLFNRFGVTRHVDLGQYLTLLDAGSDVDVCFLR